MDAAIQVEKLGKRFHIGKLKASSTLRDALTNAVKAPFRPRRHDADTILWALQNVSFEVKQGEVVGLIGRNGAGKSTLLKILARVTRPTEGFAEIKGRIGSLLEVGTGFHPELSGRENVFLSGAILGMRKAEIQKKFDEIVAFSEVERFLDTPLKHYSSGMQMRLAFAVAAHLEPEILLVDEVLAVGDASFQKKCLGKMKEVAHHGRTVIFVSHSMAAVNALCSRAAMLEQGRLTADGPAGEITTRYYARMLGQISDQGSLTAAPRAGNGKARFTWVCLQPLTPDGGSAEVAYPGCDLRIEFEIECFSTIAESIAAVIIYDRSGFRVIDTNTGQKGKHLQLNAGQKARISLVLREVLLRPGQYLVGLWLGRHGAEVSDHIEYAAGLTVAEVKDESGHPIVYPGVYLCRFDDHVSIL